MVSDLASAQHQPPGMYGEVCIYKIDPCSVSGESCHPMESVATEGTGVGWVVGGDVIAIVFEIVVDADCHTSLVDGPVILPRDDGWVVWVVGRGVACVHTMSKRTTPEA